MPRTLSHYCALTDIQPDDINTYERPLAQNAELAMQALEAVASWQRVEQSMVQLYAFLLKGNDHRAAASFMALKGIDAQSSLLLAAAKDAIPGKRLRNFMKLLNVTRKSKLRRDRLVDWSWAHSEALPDALLLCKPTVDGVETETFDDIYVYHEDDFRQIIADSARLAKLFKEYIRIALVEGDASEANEWLFSWLDRA